MREALFPSDTREESQDLCNHTRAAACRRSESFGETKTWLAEGSNADGARSPASEWEKSLDRAHGTCRETADSTVTGSALGTSKDPKFRYNLFLNTLCSQIWTTSSSLRECLKGTLSLFRVTKQGPTKKTILSDIHAFGVLEAWVMF